MKRKLKKIHKYIGLVLAEGLLSCIFCSCTSDNEIVNFDHINQITTENIDADSEQVQSDRNASGEPAQSFAEISDDQTQNSANESSEQLQSFADSTDQAQDSVNGTTDQSNVLPHEEDTVSTVLPEERYKAILLDNADFISTDLQNQKVNLTEIKKIITDDEITVKAAKFAIIDLDSDGENEVVLWIQINGVSDYGFEILRYRDGDVYGYTLQYREFMNLKTDGTFLFSGGASDTGIGKVKFSGNGYTIDKQSYSESYDSDKELHVQYFVNGEGCSEEAFQDAIRHQEEKTDISWYDLSAKSINSAFE